MRVLFINAVCGTGSTGKICASLAQQYEQEGHTARIAYGRDGFVPEQFQKYAVRIGNDFNVKLHALYTRLTDRHGFASRSATRKFLAWAEEYDPDILWLHNLHGYYINIEMLFKWIKSRPQMQVKWTLHDCWAFTGHCSHFVVAGCDAWKTGCSSHCPEKKNYPASMFLDGSKSNYFRKKVVFTGVKNLTLITPSKWLADLTRESFLKEYPVEVHYNEIDTDVFKPTKGDFREKYGLKQKKMILGVASIWTDRKGLGDFIKLAGMLDDEYIIVLVGVTEHQKKELPPNILGIERTHNAVELAQIYSAADLFINASREESFGMTTVEALLCGTYAIVYAGTASDEIVQKYGGLTIEADVNQLCRAVEFFFEAHETQL